MMMMQFSKRKLASSIIFLLIAAALVGTLVAMFAMGIKPQQVLSQVNGHSPNELIRYALTRLEGHNKLEFVLHPPLLLVQRIFERPTGSELLPNLGKGQQTISSLVAWPTADIIVSTPDELQKALMLAKAGSIIEMSPGVYRFNQNLHVGNTGVAGAPITLRASRSSDSVVEFNSVEGFFVDKPYWIFENLTIRGVCKSDSDCEHAFHIVGKANNTTLLNNRIEDFNAHIKVNGYSGEWPDHGLLSHTTLTNTHPRATSKPVTPIDLVGASHWKVSDNLITNFVKNDGNRIAFGIFMKGGGEGGRIERNLVICSPSDISFPGARVGISFGGGGTNNASCRDGSCSHFEHYDGLAANNIIAHCNDSGLDVNNSNHITLAFNTLINTSGIDVRRGSEQVNLYGNLHEGNVRVRDRSSIQENMNQPMKASELFEKPDALQLHWRTRPELVLSLRELPTDFCNQRRSDGTPPGALVDALTCTAKSKLLATTNSTTTQ